MRFPRLRLMRLVVVLSLCGVVLESHIVAQTGKWVVIAWNNLGMHCLDADFSVFAILPPYNTVQAQVIDPTGKLVTTPSVNVVYQGVADPTGSINTTSVGKSNFWQYALPLFGVSLGPDQGLGANMPGKANVAQPAIFDPALRWFKAEGIPITPYDDAGRKNTYPLMQLSAVSATGTVLATTRNVLPVSDEMDCSACHASGESLTARPNAGWVFDTNAQRDYRLNILRLHDERQAANSTYTAALSARGLSKGLYRSVVEDGKPALCATCHASNALPGTGYAGVKALTASMHAFHGHVIDPTNNLPLDASENRSACYRCHPGSETRCLRGVMGNAVAPDGTMAIQCQNCHGPMSAVGASTRAGWFQEPTCQQCHTGTATSNNGLIRYTSVFDTSGSPRVAVNQTFATQPNTPATGISLYRFSAGHGGLQCAACHGSTHAEYTASHPNDNLQSVALQGHVGTLGECSACHTAAVPSTSNGGPHGMHPVGSAWVSRHPSVAEGNRQQCTACHGGDYRGTVLSRAFGPRTINGRTVFRGQQIGCYMCHNGPGGGEGTSNRAPVAANVSASTLPGTPAGVTLSATDANGNALTYRIVSQPANGTVGLSGASATYFPFPGFTGQDLFTYAAWDGSTDSNLATVSVTVAPPSCAMTLTASVPPTSGVNQVIQLSASAVTDNCIGTRTYVWTFGDGSTASTQNPTHAYTAAGTFHWTVTASISNVTQQLKGDIVVSAVTPPPPALTVTSIVRLSEPFRLQINGTNVQAGVKVYIGQDTTAWGNVQFVSSTRVIVGGENLSRRFPSGVPVSLRIVNPNGAFVVTSFTR
jgi:Big-like domain-containing protein/PKD domain-containing protein